MNNIDILKPMGNFDLTLCRPNRNEIGVLSTAKVTSIKKIIDDIDTITFEITDKIKDRFTRLNINNPLYNEIHEERLIRLNEEEYYIIKSIEEEKGSICKKIVSTFSLEQKLNRINITLEDVSIVLLEEDVEDSELAILELLYSETGWRVGHVDEYVRFDTVDGEKVKKIRWQESISETWYTLLTDTITAIFNCVVFFDTAYKIINIYSVDTLGENIGLYLSNDNYIKSIKRQSSTDTIVTRLSLIGKDEIDIRSVNPMGRDYVENYSYFIENGDMSEKLVKALDIHNQIVMNNHIRWEDISTRKLEVEKELTKKNSELFVLCEEIKGLISIRDSYEQNDDKENAERIQKEIEEKNTVKSELEESIRILQLEKTSISNEILNINIQMDRLYAKDDHGDLIFSKELISELNEFLYYDTYSNSCYLTPKDLMNGGIRELQRKSYPTIEYEVDSINFIDRIISKNISDVNYNLSMGDLIILYDEEKDSEQFLYFVGYEYSPNDMSLNLTLSNKKTKINNTKNIADYLKQAKMSKKFVDSKSYIFNQVKYNRM